MYKWIDLKQAGDLAGVGDALGGGAAGQGAYEFLQGNLAPEIKGILVEYPYNDKDYRSTYYDFYAKKGLKYDHFCFRLHFFGEEVVFNESDLSFDWSCEKLADAYYGYSVIRPTSPTPVGRTVLSVRARKDFAGCVIQARHVVHLLGYTLAVEGYPYMQQPTDISVCAHVACWSILRHLSRINAGCAEILLSDVTKSASDMRVGGLIPSRGLTLSQAARIFSAAGLFPDTYNARMQDSYRLLNAYVQSGFPVFGALANREHAISIVGHGAIDRSAIRSTPSQDKIRYEWEAINKFVVVDDNHMPYMAIDALNGGPYNFTDITAFVVPLPEKIYFPAEEVEKRVEDLLSGGEVDSIKFDFGSIATPVVRYFVTSSSQLRAYLRKQNTAVPAPMFGALMEISLPQFVWVVQVADLQNWEQSCYNVMFVLDATASVYDQNPFFMCHDDKQVFIYDRGDTEERYVFALSGPASYGEFNENLRQRL